MVKRAKRLEKGIASLEEQINIHKSKKKIAIEEDNIERADYYEREIFGLEKAKRRKKKQIGKK